MIQDGTAIHCQELSDFILLAEHLQTECVRQWTGGETYVPKRNLVDCWYQHKELTILILNKVGKLCWGKINPLKEDDLEWVWVDDWHQKNYTKVIQASEAIKILNLNP